MEYTVFKTPNIRDKSRPLLAVSTSFYVSYVCVLFCLYAFVVARISQAMQNAMQNLSCQSFVLVCQNGILKMKEVMVLVHALFYFIFSFGLLTCHLCRWVLTHFCPELAFGECILCLFECLLLTKYKFMYTFNITFGLV